MRERSLVLRSLLGPRSSAPAGRRLVLRARIVVEVPEGQALDDLHGRLATAITAAAGVPVEAVQISPAVDPAWQTAGPEPIRPEPPEGGR